jgi:hypothetical protein
VDAGRNLCPSRGRDRWPPASSWCSTAPILSRWHAFGPPRWGYELEPPPAGFGSWDEYWRDVGVPEDELGIGADCIIDPAGRELRIWFQVVPDGKQVKNRVHLDLRPADCTREQEVERVLALGASYLADHRRPDGSGWITLADIEGNEFCILSKDPAGSGPTT